MADSVRNARFGVACLVHALLLLVGIALAGPAHAQGKIPAKVLFGSEPLPADLNPQAVGFYSSGCLAGGVAIPVDGPDWQVMRLSRNRRWGHPDLVKVIEELSVKAKQSGWNGLMIGDMSQPRGGPMLTGHTSHQVGLDVDIWFTPMPDERLTFKEREELSAISVLKPGSLYVDDKRWSRAYTNLMRETAKFSKVQRILVHPGIKKKLCDTVKGDRAWLAKVRPYYGHHYHFHVRIFCPEGSKSCKPQKAVGSDIGCDAKTLNWWFDVALKPRKPSKNDKPKKRREKLITDLPKACLNVLQAGDIAGDKAEYRIQAAAFSAPEIDIPDVDVASILASKPIEASKTTSSAWAADIDVPVPTPRPER